MVLAGLGRQLNSALSNFNKSQLINESVSVNIPA